LNRVEHIPRQTPAGTVDVEAAEFEGHVAWGFTLRVLRTFYTSAGAAQKA
jgi:hypothetical protein